jgi:hypothetical protein
MERVPAKSKRTPVAKHSTESYFPAVFSVLSRVPGRQPTRKLRATNFSASETLLCTSCQLRSFWPWNTWLRLRDYKHQGKEQPLIREASTWVQVRRSVFTGRPRPNDYEERTVAEQEHRLSITAFGRTYYVQNWQRYRQLYPEVEASAPTQESQAQP